MQWTGRGVRVRGGEGEGMGGDGRGGVLTSRGRGGCIGKHQISVAPNLTAAAGEEGHFCRERARCPLSM